LGKGEDDMAEVTPQVRQAINWISQMRSEEGNKLSLSPLIERAAVRFNLSPKDEEFIQRFFEEERKSSSEKA
jgi:hypothetical protein